MNQSSQPQVLAQPQALAQPNVMSVLVTMPMIPEAEYKKLFAETQEIRQKFMSAIKANLELQEKIKVLVQEKEALEAKITELNLANQELTPPEQLKEEPKKELIIDEAL